MSKELTKIQKMLGYKKDKSDTYKSMISYYDEYQPFLRKNNLYSDLTFDDFKEDLKHRDGQKEKFQKFADLMHTKGYNLGMAKDELCMSFDEVSIAMDGMIKKDCVNTFSKEYKGE